MPTLVLDSGADCADDLFMFVRCKTRHKDGKEHRYWSVVENVRVRGGRVVQRQVLYLGEINDSQRAAWCRTIEVLEGKSGSRQMALFPEGREAPALNCEVVRVQVQDVEVHAPRQWGACWLTLCLWERLELDRFWGPRLPASRQGTRWLDILKVLVCYRLIDPGSEWRLHRQWYEHSALRDLLGCDRVLASNTLYRCLDKLVVHKEAFFSFLHERWTRLFDARFDVVLYDLTSTYFESDPPFEDKRQFGYSRDKRSDCVQVVIALIVTPDGFPLAYEVMPGNTSDNTTLAGFLEKIENQYGRSDRVWIMDRGIPTEATLATMREGDAPVHYLVGTPKGRLGVDPNSWTPDPLGRRYPPCRDQDRRTRRSSGARWLSWCEPDGVRKSCHESSSRRRRRSATGSCKASVTRGVAGMGQAPRSERSCVAFAERIVGCAKNEISWQKPRPGLLGGPYRGGLPVHESESGRVSNRHDGPSARSLPERVLRVAYT